LKKEDLYKVLTLLLLSRKMGIISLKFSRTGQLMHSFQVIVSVPIHSNYKEMIQQHFTMNLLKIPPKKKNKRGGM